MKCDTCSDPHPDAQAEPGHCDTCGTPLEQPRPTPTDVRTDIVTEYGITVGNPFTVF